MNTMLAYLNSIYPLPEGLSERLEGIIQEKELDRKDYLLTAGRVSRNIYFVQNGLLRCYYSKGSTDVSTWFMKERDVCISVGSFFEQQNGIENIQALEKSVVSYISYEQLQCIYRDFPGFNFIGRVLTEKYYLMIYQRMAAMWMRPADERYLWLRQAEPDLFRRVPAKYLASYLGITQVMLSRLKARRL